MTNLIKKVIQTITKYYIYKLKFLPIGCDLSTDLKLKLKINPKIIFDVGANIGQTSLFFNSIYPNSKIYSFEPVTETFNALQLNTLKYKNIERFKIALGEENNSMKIKLYPKEMSELNSLNTESMNQVPNSQNEFVKINKGDFFCSENNIEKIEILKIDTEGYEIKILQGFQNMLSLQDIDIILCEIGLHSKDTRHTNMYMLSNFLENFGYSLFGIYNVSNCEIQHKSNYANALFVGSNYLKKIEYK